jgi:hypothetical protein
VPITTEDINEIRAIRLHSLSNMQGNSDNCASAIFVAVLIFSIDFASVYS